MNKNCWTKRFTFIKSAELKFYIDCFQILRFGRRLVSPTRVYNSVLEVVRELYIIHFECSNIFIERVCVELLVFLSFINVFERINFTFFKFFFLKFWLIIIEKLDLINPVHNFYDLRMVWNDLFI